MPRKNLWTREELIVTLALYILPIRCKTFPCGAKFAMWWRIFVYGCENVEENNANVVATYPKYQDLVLNNSRKIKFILNQVQPNKFCIFALLYAKGKWGR